MGPCPLFEFGVWGLLPLLQGWQGSLLRTVGEVPPLQTQLCLTESRQPPRRLAFAGMFAHLLAHRAM